MIFVALLRGINVGGKSSVSMTQLKHCFEKLGYTQVTTYINSGNVIFQDDQTNPRKLEEEIEKELERTFGFPIRVLVKNLEEMQNLINHIPKKWRTQTDPPHSEESWRQNVIFLSHRIDNPTSFTTLTPNPDIEEVQYFPGVLLWSAKTSDLTKSTMVRINKSELYKEMTVRNLNTTLKLFQLMQDLQINPQLSS